MLRLRVGNEEKQALQHEILGRHGEVVMECWMSDKKGRLRGIMETVEMMSP